MKIKYKTDPPTEMETFESIQKEVGKVKGALDGTAKNSEQLKAATFVFMKLMIDFEARTGELVPPPAHALLAALRATMGRLRHPLLKFPSELSYPKDSFGPEEHKWIRGKCAATATAIIYFSGGSTEDVSKDIAAALEIGRYVSSSGKRRTGSPSQLTTRTIKDWLRMAEKEVSPFQEQYLVWLTDILSRGFKSGKWKEDLFVERFDTKNLLREIVTLCDACRLDRV